MLKIETISDVHCAHGTIQSLNVFCFVTDGLMIDTSSQTMLEKLIPFFSSVDFDQVVHTHYHEDHTGGSAWIQEHKQVPLYIHPQSIDICSEQGDYPDYRKLVWGVRAPFTALPLKEKFQSRTTDWDTIYTPGHTTDHMSFLNRDKGMLFTGDLFITPKTKIILREENLNTTMNSIKTVLKLDFQEVFCSHAGYLANGKEMLRLKLAYLENLKGEIFHMHKQGLSVQEIKQTLFPAPYPIISFSQHEWDSEHIITSLLETELLNFA